jgi:hypothetical protein
MYIYIFSVLFDTGEFLRRTNLCWIRMLISRIKCYNGILKQWPVNWSDLSYELAKYTRRCFRQYLICVYYLFVNITRFVRFDLHSVILFCCFYGGNRVKPTGKTHFSCLRVRSASSADMRMPICYQNNGGSNISKRENIKLWRNIFPNCAPVSLGEQRILIK